VLPNGVDPARWSAERPPGRPGELRLASVMRFYPRKRGRALLRAVARAQRELRGSVRLHLTLVGEGPEGPRLRRLARRLGLSDQVRFTGYLPREEVREVLASSDAFVLASRLESFGIAALEARAAGVPVVALDHGGIKEFVRDRRDGLIARTDADLATSLVRLAREPELMAALSAGAREQPVPCSWEECVGRHLRAYCSVMDGSPQGLVEEGPAEAAVPVTNRPDAA
jgi:glycosyltransferase involved in cell wall biosynthesis